MKGSIRIATIFKIPVHLHWTFFLIFIYIYFMGRTSAAPELSISYTLLIIGLFVCVLMHEFGHALTARYYGVDTHDIILSPIGGIARLNKLPEKPVQEFWVAVAGPAVNIFIALLLSPIYYFLLAPSDRSNLVNSLFNASGNFSSPDLSLFGFIVVGLFWLNIILALFNLVPAFPMDGGRVLRALLSLRLNRIKATRYAAFIGQFFAVVFIGIGIFSQPLNFLYVFIGIFIFMTAANEYRMVRLEYLMQNTQSKALIKTRSNVLYLNDEIQKAQAFLAAKGTQYFMVVDQWENVKGILDSTQIKQAIEEGQGANPIYSLALYKPYFAYGSSNLNESYKKMNASPSKTLCLLDKYGNTSGLIDYPTFNKYVRTHHKSVK